jgi:hypothetical protein
MSEFIKVEKDIWKLEDGSLWEGNINQCPEGNPDSVAKAGKEYQLDYLELHGYGKKKAAVKKAPETKAQKPAEDK